MGLFRGIHLGTLDALVTLTFFFFLHKKFVNLQVFYVDNTDKTVEIIKITKTVWLTSTI